MGPKPKKSDTSKSKISTKSKDKDKKGKDKSKEKSKTGSKDKDKSSKKTNASKLSKGKDTKKKDKKLDKSLKKDDKNISDLTAEELDNSASKNFLKGEDLGPNIINPTNENLPHFSNPNQPGLQTLPNSIPEQPAASEKCEGCFNGTGYCFCNECGKIYCKICDDQLHVVPAFREHERLVLDTFNNFKTSCYHHSEHYLRYFCESCQEPMCKMCQEIGPHNNPMHRVSSIFSVYRKYLDDAKTKIGGPIKEKSDKIQEIMVSIERLIKENKEKAEVMLKGINSEYEGVVENIHKIDGQKKAILNYNSAEMQKDILEINSILEFFDTHAKKKPYHGAGNLGVSMTNGMNMMTYNDNYLTSDHNTNILLSDNNAKTTTNRLRPAQSEDEKMLEFILKSKSLQASIEQLISKPTSNMLTKEEEINIVTFPKEINENKIKLRNYKKKKALLKVKDDIVWNFMNIPYEELNPELEQIRIKTEQEVAEWTKLTKKYAIELKKFNLTCAFCGCLLADKMNEKCPLNAEQEDKFENRNFTKDFPTMNAKNTGRHYFGEITEDYAEKVKNGDLFDPSTVIRERKILKGETNVMNQGFIGNLTTGNLIANNLEETKPSYDQEFINELLKQSMSKRAPRQAVKPVLTNEWVTKVARIIEKDKINLFQVLSEYDHKNDGTITLRDLIIAFIGIHVILSEMDKESLTKYIKISGYNEKKIEIKKIAQNFGKTNCAPAVVIKTDGSYKNFDVCENPLQKENSRYNGILKNNTETKYPNTFDINTSIKVGKELKQK